MPTGFHRIAAAMVAVAVATTSCSRLAQAQSAPAWAYPIGTRTGVPAVDAALRAIEAGDTAAFEALFVLTSTSCTEPGAGEIACPPGQPVGTPVEVFPVPQCEGASVQRGDPVLAEIASVVVSRPLFLYAVGELSPAEWPNSSHVIFLGSAKDSGSAAQLPAVDQAVMVFTSAEGVHAINIGCGSSAARRVAEVSPVGFVLAPKSAPGAPNTGTGMGDVRHAGSAWVLALITSVTAGCVAAATYKLARAGGMESRA